MALNRPARLILAALMLVAAGALLLASGAARHRGSGTTVSGDLTITWSTSGDGLTIVATGYRRRSTAQVSVASQPKHQVTADDTGTVRLFVALDAVTQGQVGTTIVVAGRAPSNATRSLVGGVPPLAVNRGPEDAVPWVIAVLLVLLAAGVAGLRPRPVFHRVAALLSGSATSSASAPDHGSVPAELPGPTPPRTALPASAPRAAVPASAPRAALPTSAPHEALPPSARRVALPKSTTPWPASASPAAATRSPASPAAAAPAPAFPSAAASTPASPGAVSSAAESTAGQQPTGPAVPALRRATELPAHPPRAD